MEAFFEWLVQRDPAVRNDMLLFEEHHIRASALRNMTYKQSISGTPFSEGDLHVSWVETAFRFPCSQGAEKVLKGDWEGGQNCSMHS